MMASKAAAADAKACRDEAADEIVRRTFGKERNVSEIEDWCRTYWDALGPDSYDGETQTVKNNVAIAMCAVIEKHVRPMVSKVAAEVQDDMLAGKRRFLPTMRVMQPIRCFPPC